MTSDPKPFDRQPLRHAFPWPSHDEVAAVNEQCWRLMQGPEPSHCLCSETPGPLLRFGPYH